MSGVREIWGYIISRRPKTFGLEIQISYKGTNQWVRAKGDNRRMLEELHLPGKWISCKGYWNTLPSVNSYLLMTEFEFLNEVQASQLK